MTATGVVTGLTTEHARLLLAEHGPNVVPPLRRPAWWRRLGLQLRDPLIVVLLVAAALTVATGDHPDAVIIALVIVVNTTVGLAQEIKADNALAALSQLTAARARVIRDSRTVTVDAAAVVPGDVIVLGEGDIVPADATLRDAVALVVDESAMTGESVPVDKEVGLAGDLAAGTVVVHGRGLAVVSRTGPHSSLGRIAAAVAQAPALTPLQRRLARLGRVLATVAGVLCIVVMVIGLVRGQPAELMVVTAISLVVAAVPESLPAVVTLSLALGARRMAARHAIVRRLPAVETLGSVTVIATDKTGTLTEGAMVVEQLWTPSRSNEQTTQLLSAAALCNDADIEPAEGPDGGWRPVGDPTEAALVAAATELPLAVSELRTQFPRVDEIPFDSNRKRMTTVHRAGGQRFLTICKGAPEVVLTPGLLDDPAELLARAAAQAAAYADAGFRVMAIATTTRSDPPSGTESPERHLHLAGLLALADPPRTAANATIAACKAAGITPVLITGDHVATARSIAERVGIIDSAGATVTGAQLGSGIPDPNDVAVFARTDPTEKLTLVETWQSRGHVVAMTGDGVNDAPALRRADIGVAMGLRGTEIAREAADIVLTDDDLGTVVAAVEEGRRVYANVRRFLLYGLAGGTAEILIMLAGPAVGLALPLLPAQILWVNLLTHGLPGVAMGAEPIEPDSMSRPPRPPSESVLGAGLWPRVLAVGGVVAGVSLGVGLWAHATARPWQSLLFLALGMAQFGVALGVRARPGTWANPFLLVAVGGAFLLQLAGVYAAPLRDLLETKSLPPAEAAAVCAVAAVGYVAARVARRNRLSTSPPGL